MANVKENELTKLITDLSAGGWLRVVNAAGESKDLLKTLFTLPQSQIVGLVDALAAKGAIPVIKSQSAFIQASGAINGSGREIKVITDEASLNLAFNGDYTAVTPFAVDFLGNVQNVIAWDDSVTGEPTVTPSVRTMARQLVFSDCGIFYRLYSVAGGWGSPIFMGGTHANYTFTYRADLVAVAAINGLIPGVLYRIMDHGNDEGIIIQAATSSTFYSDGIRLGLVPAHFLADTYDSVVWIGVWRIGIGDAGVVAGNKAVFMGRVWTNLTGNIGAVDGSDAWSLDSTNWALSTVEAGLDYARMVFGCTYDIQPLGATGYISKQWDGRGNIFGVPVEPIDGFLVEYNDWGNPFIYGNELKSIRNCIAIAAGSSIYGNNGKGDIYNVSGATVFLNRLSNYDNNIRDIACSAGEISNNILTSDADIQYLNGASYIRFNTIESDLKGDVGAYCAADVQNSYIGHNIVKDNITLSIQDSIINGHIDGNASVALVRTVMLHGSTITGLNSSDPITDSVLAGLFPNASIGGEFTTIRQSQGKICGSISMDRGGFSIPTGATYSAKTILSESITITPVRSNGVTITGQTFVAQFAGWHRIKATMSLSVTSSCIFESAIFINSIDTGLYDSVDLVADESRRVEIDNYIQLSVGDVVSIRHRHSLGTTVDFTNYSSSFTLEYDN